MRTKLFERMTARQFEGRYSFSHRNYNGDCDGHPDLRAIPCPEYLVLKSEIIKRAGNGYVLSDGFFYDPGTDEFFGVITEN